jgi:hypothetical protein
LTSEVGKTVVPPGGELVLPPRKDSDSLSVQLETVRLSGVGTKNMIEYFIEMGLRLSGEVGHFRKDNEILKMKAENYQCLNEPTVRDICARFIDTA